MPPRCYSALRRFSFFRHHNIRPFHLPDTACLRGGVQQPRGKTTPPRYYAHMTPLRNVDADATPYAAATSSVHERRHSGAAGGTGKNMQARVHDAPKECGNVRKEADGDAPDAKRAGEYSHQRTSDDILPFAHFFMPAARHFGPARTLIFPG